jgi:hypothetical protein
MTSIHYWCVQSSQHPAEALDIVRVTGQVHQLVIFQQVGLAGRAHTSSTQPHLFPRHGTLEGLGVHGGEREAASVGAASELVLKAIYPVHQAGMLRTPQTVLQKCQW